MNTPVDVVINPKKSLLTAEFTELLREVEKAFAVIQQKARARREPGVSKGSGIMER